MAPPRWPWWLASTMRTTFRRHWAALSCSLAIRSAIGCFLSFIFIFTGLEQPGRIGKGEGFSPKSAFRSVFIPCNQAYKILYTYLVYILSFFKNSTGKLKSKYKYLIRKVSESSCQVYEKQRKYCRLFSRYHAWLSRYTATYPHFQTCSFLPSPVPFPGKSSFFVYRIKRIVNFIILFTFCAVTEIFSERRGKKRKGESRDKRKTDVKHRMGGKKRRGKER